MKILNKKRKEKNEKMFKGTNVCIKKLSNEYKENEDKTFPFKQNFYYFKFSLISNYDFFFLKKKLKKFSRFFFIKI